MCVNIRRVESHVCIDRDLACVECEYNLRSLPAEGRCPECGTDVARSIAEAPSRFGRVFDRAAWLLMCAGIALTLLTAGFVVSAKIAGITSEGLDYLRWTNSVGFTIALFGQFPLSGRSGCRRALQLQWLATLIDAEMRSSARGSPQHLPLHMARSHSDIEPRWRVRIGGYFTPSPV